MPRSRSHCPKAESSLALPRNSAGRKQQTSSTGPAISDRVDHWCNPFAVYRWPFVNSEPPGYGHGQRMDNGHQLDTAFQPFCSTA
jgi:hypothetical protein